MIPKKGLNPLNQIGAHTFTVEEREESQCLHIIKTILNVKEQGGDFVAKAVEGYDVVLQYCSSVSCAPPRKGTALEGVYEGAGQRLN